jgi:peptidylprolyl isomerase
VTGILSSSRHDKISYVPGLIFWITDQVIFFVKEISVKHNPKRFLWLLSAIIMVFTISACQPAELAVEPTEVPVDLPADSDPLESSDTSLQGELINIEGAITTDSGLQFLETNPGEGPNPKDGDIVTMNFVASLPDGTEFGNSYQQGGPIKAILGRDQLLPGWEEGLKLMNAGGQARMVLPSELAFGTEGYGMIPPDSPIILVVEIISIEVPPNPFDYSEGDLTTTESGLQYYDILTGDGESAQNGDIVSNNFTLWVMGDPEHMFIGSSEDGQSISFELGKGDTVFPGWEEGNLGMKVGGKRLLVIPPELGLGETGAGDISPNAVLIMEITLLEISEPVMMTEVDGADYTITESGLKYYDILEGDGRLPETGQTVVVHYTGWLEDGTKFDSSLDRNQPFSFQIGAGMVIQGWDEGVASMKVGGKRQLVIPPDLGYGETGSGGTIPPGATLIFDVELLEIQE